MLPSYREIRRERSFQPARNKADRSVPRTIPLSLNTLCQWRLPHLCTGDRAHDTLPFPAGLSVPLVLHLGCVWETLPGVLLLAFTRTVLTTSGIHNSGYQTLQHYVPAAGPSTSCSWEWPPSHATARWTGATVDSGKASESDCLAGNRPYGGRDTGLKSRGRLSPGCPGRQP